MDGESYNSSYSLTKVTTIVYTLFIAVNVKKHKLKLVMTRFFRDRERKGEKYVLREKQKKRD